MTKRIDWIDIAKGIGIILVIFAHSNQTIISKYIYMFHMPLFIYLSGRLFNNNYNNFGHFIRHKIIKLVIPYFTYGSMIIIFNIIRNCFINGLTNAIDRRIIDDVIRIFVVYNRTVSLYFLLVLFWLNIILYILIYLEKKYKIKSYVVVLLLLIIGQLLYKFNIYSFPYCLENSIPFNIDIALTTLPFFYCGYIVSKKHKTIEKMFSNNKLIYGISFLTFGFIIGSIGLIKTNRVLDIFFCEYANVFLTYVSSFLCVFGLCMIAKNIKSKYLSYIGENSMIYFAIHQSIVFVLIDDIFNVFDYMNNRTVFVNYIYPLLITLVSIFIITVINRILSSNKTICRIFSIKYIEKVN